MKDKDRFKDAFIEHMSIVSLRHGASKDRIFHFWFEYQDEIAKALERMAKGK